MEYLYTTLIDDPHELCMWAKEDIDRAYKKSCIDAIRDISHNIAKRTKLNEEAEQLVIRLKEAHDKEDVCIVADILSLIKDNIQSKRL